MGETKWSKVSPCPLPIKLWGETKLPRQEIPAGQSRAVEPVGWVTWCAGLGGSAGCAEGPGAVPVAEDTIPAVWVGKGAPSPPPSCSELLCGEVGTCWERSSVFKMRRA